MNDTQEIRKSQGCLGSKYEEIKDELKTMQNINCFNSNCFKI